MSNTDEARIKAYMAAKMAHIKMYNECMTLADGLDVEKFAELVRADERKKSAWVGLTDEEANELHDAWQKRMDGWGSFYQAIEAKLKEKNVG